MTVWSMATHGSELAPSSDRTPPSEETDQVHLLCVHLLCVHLVCALRSCRARESVLLLL